MAKRSTRSAAARRRRQATRPASAGAKRAKASESVDFREEYQYVLADLKRFGLLAVAMFALLIVLALVL